MTTKELLLQQIEQLDEEELDALFAWVQQMLERRVGISDGDFLIRLGEIKIDGPEDFSTNLDLYLSGRKLFDVGLH